MKKQYHIPLLEYEKIKKYVIRKITVVYNVEEKFSIKEINIFLLVSLIHFILKKIKMTLLYCINIKWNCMYKYMLSNIIFDCFSLIRLFYQNINQI